MSSKPKKNRTKQYLMLLTVAGLIAIVGGSSSGTFASFTAETTNAGNYFATGTLLLHDNGGNTTCKSEDGTLNANNSGVADDCDVLFHLQPLRSSSTTQYAHLTLTNAGTIDSDNIAWDAPYGCLNSTVDHASLSSTVTSGVAVPASIAVTPVVGTIPSGATITIDDNVGHTQTLTTTATASAGDLTISVDTTGAPTWNATYPANTTAVNYGPTFGSPANLCTSMQVAVVETDGTFSNNIDDAHSIGCAFGGAGTTGCAFDGSDFLSSIPTSLANLTLASPGGTGNTDSNLAAGGTRYFLIAVKPPTSIDNQTQNRAATFDLRFHLEAS